MTKLEMTFDDLERAQVEFELDGFTVAAPSKEHIIALKQQALADDPRRKKDRLDIEALVRSMQGPKR